MHNSQWITFPTQSCLGLISLCAKLLHSLIMWLIVSFLSQHNLHLLFCCVLSLLALTYLVLMALFCAAIRRDSVSLFRFPFLSHVQVFSWEISLVCRLKYSYNCFCFLVIFVFLMIVWTVWFLRAVISLPGRSPWCNGYRCRKWTRRHEFKPWARLIVFHIALIPLGKAWIQLSSLQLWVNSRADCVLQPWWGNSSRRRKTEFKPVKLRLKIDLVSYPARAEGLGK